MSKKKKKKNQKYIIPCIVVLFIVIAIILMVVLYNKKEYRIIVDGQEYLCTTREKSGRGSVLGFSKESYESKEEALEACKQGEVIIYSSTGQLEEYQEARKKCEYKDEDDEYYNLTPENIYSYKNCEEVK